MNLKQVRERLEHELAELTGAPQDREELKIETLPDSIDQIQSATARELAIVRLDHHARQARDLRIALGKIEDGTYGICESCDEPIAPRRLAALPCALLCVHCQSKAENESRSYDFAFEEAA
ncbi:MAG: TraR/DksA family transcriptional regulator [Bryobacteraceae bacterium]|nr:TraR/DksA family transcriptional regulator [Bryobacteraceae bacterium]